MLAPDNVCLPDLELNMTATQLRLFAIAGIMVATVSLAGCGRAVVDTLDPESLDADQTLSAQELNEGATPILISVSNKKLSLTDAAHGVTFDIDNNGSGDHVSWTTTDSDDGFLALDRNANNTIDNGGELFGNVTQQPASANKNGFLALAEYDKAANGGNGDGKIDSHDSIHGSLRIWQDKNHNGISEASELHNLAHFQITSLDLKYHTQKKHDKFGNIFRYRAKVGSEKHSKVAKEAYDVILLVQP
jgi:hypothetical protein